MQEWALEPLQEFFAAIRSPVTRRKYELRLAQFLDYAGAKGETLAEKARYFTNMARKDYDRTTFVINSFLQEQKTRAEAGEINASTISIYVKPIKLFCEMNDVMVNWKKLSRKLPPGRHYANDRAPTKAEIKTLLEYPDRRIAPAILTMVSSGIRIGGWETLCWGDIEPLTKEGEPATKEGQVAAAKLRVYPGDREEYYTFLSGEAFRSIESYIAFRKSQGETIGPKSPVLRDLFVPDRSGEGLPQKPVRLATNGVKRLLENALKKTGLRGKLPEGKRRHEWQGAHGFRKFFKSVCENRMKSLNVEMLLGHDTGLNESYYRPSTKELLADYLKAMPDLTILEKVEAQQSEDVVQLKSRVQELDQRVAQLEAEKQGMFDRFQGMIDKALETRRAELKAKPRK